MNPDQFKQMIQWSSQNPSAPQALEFKKRIESGAYNDTASQLGLKPEQLGVQQAPVQDTSKGINRVAGSAPAGTPNTIEGAIGKSVNRVKDSVKARQQNFIESANKESLGQQSKAETMVNLAGNVGGIAQDVAGEAFHLTGADKILNPILSFFGKGADKIGTAVGKKAAEVVTPEQKKQVMDFLTHPDTLRVLQGIKSGEDLVGGAMAIAGGAEGIKNIPKATTAVKDAAVGAAGKIGDVVSGAGETMMSPIKAVKDYAIGAKDVGTGRVSGLLENTQEYLSRKNVPENFDTSVGRLAEPPKVAEGKPMPTPKDPLAMYDEFYQQEQKFKGDIKQDTAISKVGERMGNAFEKVAKMRQDAGKVMESEMQRVGSSPTDISKSFPKFEEELARNGLDVVKTDRGFELKPNRTSKVTTQDAQLLKGYFQDLKKLGENPTAAELDAFLSRTPKNLDVYKSKNNITKTTNGERIVKWHLANLRDALTPQANPDFTAYSQAKADYSSLTNFLEEGQKFLGKKTQAGDYAKDASVAKSSVQSILNQGKKDWMLKLEDLTGYQAIDESMLALQAMSDSGNFRGKSLLDLLNPKEGTTLPTSKGGAVRAIVNAGVEAGKEKLVGSPSDQTRRIIQARMRQNEAATPSQFEPTNTGSTKAEAPTKSTPLQGEVGNYKTAEEFSSAVGDIFKRSRELAGGDSAVYNEKISKADKALMQKARAYLETPEVLKMYDEGMRDPEILANFYKENVKAPPKGKGAIPETSEFKNFERDTTLKGEDAAVQERSIEKYLANKDALLKEYTEKNGSIVNTDEARKLFADVGYNGNNAAAVQEAASALAKDAWRKALKENPGKDAVMYAGGSGTGKTSAATALISESLKGAAAVLDGNLSMMKSALSRISEAIKSGKDPHIVYVYRNPIEAWVDGVIERMKNNKKEGGRVVPLSVFLENHKGSYEVVRGILKEGQSRVTLIDNSLGLGKQEIMGIDKFNKIEYAENLKDILTKKTKKLYEEGKITKQQYNALVQ